jgi:hypothetical protein
MLRALVLALVVAGCDHSPSPARTISPPVPDAVADADVRAMLADIAATRACERIDDHFHALRDSNRHDVVTGVVWFHGCTSTHDGGTLTFKVGGSGWQWIDRTAHEAGGTFTVRQYVRFNATATIVGTLDLGYDQTTHVASLWFSPASAPRVVLDPIGKVDVEHSGAWSSVVGTVSAMFARSPEREGVKQAKREGTQQFTRQLSEGLTFTIDLCSGVMRSTTGHLPKGQMVAPDVLESSRTTFELQPGGLLMLGPQRARDGMTISVDTPGQLDLALACRADADAVARAYLDGTPPPAFSALAELHEPGASNLTIGATACPVAVIARSRATAGPPLQFTVTRSSTEIGFTNGGPLVSCAK